MAEIQRYEPQHVLTAPLGMMRADDEGEYVFHADHLAEMAKKDREIEQLTAQRDRLLDALLRIFNCGGHIDCDGEDIVEYDGIACATIARAALAPQPPVAAQGEQSESGGA